MAAGVTVFVVLAVGLGFGLALYWAVRAESVGRERTSRTEAEWVARRDVPDGSGERRGSGR